MKKVYFEDLGRIDYQDAWDYQTNLHKALITRKLENRKASSVDKETGSVTHHLLFCEHPPVYTLGKSGSEDHLLLNSEELEAGGFQYFRINRGGDITYHGPGQIVVYPIFDLDDMFTDVHRYVRYLEEAVIRTLADYGLKAIREKGYTGVWMAPDRGAKRKICAIGVHLSRWVSMHGLAFNVKPDLSHFGHIVPCGIVEEDRTVTSLQMELNRTVDINEVKDKLKGHFADLFSLDYVEA